jgi:hypothetical protein
VSICLKLTWDGSRSGEGGGWGGVLINPWSWFGCDCWPSNQSVSAPPNTPLKLTAMCDTITLTALPIVWISWNQYEQKNYTILNKEKQSTKYLFKMYVAFDICKHIFLKYIILNWTVFTNSLTYDIIGLCIMSLHVTRMFGEQWDFQNNGVNLLKFSLIFSIFLFLKNRPLNLCYFMAFFPKIGQKKTKSKG